MNTTRRQTLQLTGLGNPPGTAINRARRLTGPGGLAILFGSVLVAASSQAAGAAVSNGVIHPDLGNSLKTNDSQNTCLTSQALPLHGPGGYSQFVIPAIQSTVSPTHGSIPPNISKMISNATDENLPQTTVRLPC